MCVFGWVFCNPTTENIKSSLEAALTNKMCFISIVAYESKTNKKVKLIEANENKIIYQTERERERNGMAHGFPERAYV